MTLLPRHLIRAKFVGNRTRRTRRTRRTAVRTLLPTLQQTLTAIVFAGGLSLAEYAEASSEPLTAHAPTVEYTRGPDMGGGVGGLLYSSRHEGSQPSPTLRYALSNGRGDIVAQADQNAALTWTASYEAYGKRTRETGSNADKQRANSKDEDPTGLLNEGFRYRDLETGVWLSRDPAGFVDGPNLYAYVTQNPWTAFDPDGLALDTVWDVGNVIHDVGRVVKNGCEMGWGAAATGYHKVTGNSAAADASWNGIQGDWGEMKQAAGDTALDAGATLVPGLPAGIQKVARAGMNAYDKVERAEAAEKAAEGDVMGALNEAANAAGTLPGSKKGKIESSARPKSKYSNIPDPRNVAAGKDFTPATKKKILEQNREQNGGTVRSDKSGEATVPSQKSQTGVTPPPNEAQIDHIIPKAKGGTNSPSNAQVLTRKENRDKSDE